ncbi:hypothetical protein JB92DRAFT_2837665 [Gautieria morchelliformis]|nr:hypothetical protein JB92DRAFT_2837665 [Gautieria morchelliformis]
MTRVRADNSSPLASKPENESSAGWCSGCGSCDSADSQPAVGRERTPNSGAHGGTHRRDQSTALGQSLQTVIPIGPVPTLRDPQCNKGGVLTRGKGRGSTVLTYNADNSMDCAGACKAIVTMAAMSPRPLGG